MQAGRRHQHSAFCGMPFISITSKALQLQPAVWAWTLYVRRAARELADPWVRCCAQRVSSR